MMSWNKAMRRAAADRPAAAEPGEIIIHPDQAPMFDDVKPGPAPVRPVERFEVKKHCPLFDGHPKVTSKLF